MHTEKDCRTAVVVATYNGASYVLEQLDSIRLQSVPVDAVYLADDGSDDGTVDLVREWIARHHLDSWEIRVNPENLGYPGNFMRLISKAAREGADYIFLADQDDIWLPGKVEQMLATVRRFPGTGLLCSDLEPFYSGGNASHYGLARLRWGAMPFLRFSAQWIWALRPGCTFLLEAGFARKAADLWERPDVDVSFFAHDTFLWALAHLEKRIACLPRVTMRYRRHESNNSGTVSLLDRRHRIDDLRLAILKMDFFLTRVESPESGFIDRQKRFFLRRLEYLSRGRIAWLRLMADGLLHLNLYVKRRHYLSDLYVCARSKGKI